MDKLIEWMEGNGFFDAPCSTQHHLCKEGGLAEHSLNVYDIASRLYMVFPQYFEVPFDSVVIAALLHDIGKCGQFGKRYYVENYLSKPDKEGNPVRSTAKPYITNAELLNVPHEVRSLSIVDRFIDLTEEEAHAIYYHNGKYTHIGYDLKETPLQILIHTADMFASRLAETKAGEEQPE
jgi:23S rRNA maturation-related 3'-5' exoribonuclease YhaM